MLGFSTLLDGVGVPELEPRSNVIFLTPIRIGGSARPLHIKDPAAKGLPVTAMPIPPAYLLLLTALNCVLPKPVRSIALCEKRME
jgi:hypothetical protein